MTRTSPAVFERLESRRLLSVSTPTVAALDAAAVAPAALTPLGPAAPAVTWDPSPNFNSRGGTTIDSIVIHTTEGSFAGALSWLKNPASQVSAHYIVNTDGKITQLVDLANRAWHATYYNSRSIGIEIVGFAGQPSTWNAQNVAAVEKLVAWLAWKHDVPVVRPAGDALDYPNDRLDAPGIVAHGQVQPWNRTDPGPHFPWTSFLANVRRIIDQSVQRPYGGKPVNVGRGGVAVIQAENYDLGGEGVAFHDTTPTVNTGGAYRNGAIHGGVDVKRIDTPSATAPAFFRLTDTRAGEWTEYSINVAAAGTYRVDLRLSQADPNGRLRVLLDGTSLATFAVPDTNSFNVFTTVGRTLSLPAGRHVLRLSLDRMASGNPNVAGVDWLKITPVVTTPATPLMGRGNDVLLASRAATVGPVMAGTSDAAEELSVVGGA